MARRQQTFLQNGIRTLQTTTVAGNGGLQFGASATFNSNEGYLMFFYYQREQTFPTTAPRLLYFQSTITNNIIDVAMSGSTNQIVINLTSGGVSILNSVVIAPSPAVTNLTGRLNHFALSYGTSGLTAWINGIQVYNTATDCHLVSSGTDSFYIGDFHASSNGLQPTGTFSSIVYGRTNTLNLAVVQANMTTLALPSDYISYWSCFEGRGTNVPLTSGAGPAGVFIDLTGGRGGWGNEGIPTNRQIQNDLTYALQCTGATPTRSSIPYSNLGTSITYNVWIQTVGLTSTLKAIVAFARNIIRISTTSVSWFPDSIMAATVITTSLPSNGIFMLTVSQSGSNSKFYKNGSLIGSSTTSNPVSPVNSFPPYCWADYPFSPAAFTGVINEGAIWSRQLSDQEVQLLYTSHTPPQSGLYAYYKWDEGSGTTAIDSSGNGNDGTISGGAYVPTFFPKARTQQTTRTTQTTRTVQSNT